MAAATVGRFPGVGRAQASPSSLVPSVLRHYSSKDGQCYNTATYTEIEIRLFPVKGFILRFPRLPHHSKSLRNWFLDRVVKDFEKVGVMIQEVGVTIHEAGDLLNAGLEDKACAMYGKGTDDCLKAIALYEKVIDDSAKGFGNTQGIPLDILEPHRLLCKELENLHKSMRYILAVNAQQ
ncbi:hypothetical protein ACP70R_032965 [Stipagrostis hirtigluma subsp. patula]